MQKKATSGVMLTLLLASILSLALDIQPVKATGTIYIRPDGSVDPSTAPIQRDGDTYTFTGNVYDSIVVEKDDIVIDGVGHIVQGTGSGTGIDLSGRTNVTVKNAKIADFSGGVQLYQSSNNSISGNNITGGYSNIWLQWSSNNTISGNNIDTGAIGLDFSYSSNCNTISGNNITNLEYGLSFGYSCNYNTVSGNNVRANTQYAVCLDSSSNNTFSQNNVMNNGQGVYLSNGCSNNTFSGNNIANQYSGILIESENLPSNYNSISGNTIANNTHGIDIYYSHNSTVSGNTITNSTYGIFLLGSGNGTFSGNTVTNSTYGIYLSMSSNNIIYHNNFIDNSQQVSINPSGYTNVWDDGYPSGGNYWSDYTGMDLYWGLYQNKTGSDGIGDTPYVIDGNNRDNYPLISPYEYWSSPILGDINKDMKVDSDDLSQISLVYGSTAENPDWNPNCDINGDDKVDVLDLFKLGKNYGETAEAIGTNVARASSIAVFLHPFTVLPMLTVVCKGRKISRKFKSITRRMRAHGILTQIYQQKRCSTRSLRQNSWD